jgi:hypothetical protein
MPSPKGGEMTVIQPCHYCSRPVYSDRGADYVHEVVCSAESCQQRRRESDERMQAALDRVSQSRKEVPDEGTP